MAGQGPAPEQKRLTARYPMHVVGCDFQSDVPSWGRHIRFSNVIDEYICTASAIILRRSFKAADVVAVLENIIAETGTARAYLRRRDTAFIDPDRHGRTASSSP